VRFALNVPNFGEYADPATFIRLAREAETAGWDGLFVWDHILVDPDWGVPIADPWVLLSAAATVTDRIRLGPMVTPLPRRRPWVVARQAVTLDHLSAGRLTLGVGLGFPPGPEFEAFGEDGDARVRAARLDEGLAILAGLWTGEPFQHDGAVHHLDRMRFLPTPVQQPRIPIWVAGYWPAQAPFRRAARWDGVFPASHVTEESGQPMPLDELEAVLACIRAERGPGGLDGYDVMIAGGTPADPDEAGRILEPYAAAGVTWWSEGLNGWRGPLQSMEERLLAGPPRIPARQPA
jgi:alkanesulfonate monooxygenase SsuD/methylene tetrahydromethanopterin reductase-like flavin-dependent oxidoreductase (luciferase family)